MDHAVATRGIGRVIAATSLGFVLVQLDVSVLNVALASLGGSLHIGLAGLQWVVDSYAITFAALLLAAGEMGDRLGSRRIYLAGFAVFIAASLACALAPTALILIAARAVQGVGAALLVPTSLALLTHACGDDTRLRGRAISLWTAAASVSLAAGPVLGGFLVGTQGWRSIFFLNVPVGAFGIWLTLQAVGETAPRHARFDFAGQLLALCTLLALTAGIIEAGRLGVTSPAVIGALLIGALAGVAFVVTEARSAEPMLPLGFFRNRSFSAATGVGLLLNLTLYGAVFMLGLHLQRGLGDTPIQAGLALLPFPIALGIGNVTSGPVGARFGRRWPMVFGLVVGAIGYGLLWDAGAAMSYAALLAGLVLVPAGTGLAVPLMTSALLATVPRQRSGVASGVLNTVRQAGGCIGVAVCGALMDTGGLTAAFALCTVLSLCAALTATVIADR
jgi:DHA2 family methylenomycin A resistance protein-like MFS transporter